MNGHRLRNMNEGGRRGAGRPLRPCGAARPGIVIRLTEKRIDAL
jgi:hypothetical protein